MKTSTLVPTSLRRRPNRRAVPPYLRGDRGSMLTWAALLMVPLLGFMGLGVDTARAYLVKARLGQALDAATLAAGRSNADQAGSEERAKMVFKANFPAGFQDASLTGPTFVFNNAEHTVKGSATAAVPTYFMHLVGQKNYHVSASTEVKRNANSLEIALVLDITGSMSGSRITDLKTAAKDLVETIVWEDQSEYYSKIAIIPYSNSVNVGTYAAQVRGAVPVKNITGATKANPVVITSNNHGFSNGDKVFISGVKGMTQINNNLSNSSTATTSPQYWVVASKTTNTFTLTRSNGSNADGRNWSTYTSSSGTIDCMAAGCQYNYFTSASNTTNIFTISTCVSERTGTNAYTDVAPSTAFVGDVYAVSNNPCVGSTIMPLSSDKAALKSKIDSLAIAGSTAGQIGIAWGWYMISPNFAYLWPSASQPAAYGTDELMKIAVIMTDGEFNTAYCNGVIAKDSGSGSGNNADHINCNATNGSSSSQALKLCTEMKKKNIIVFTVGFDLDTQAAKDLMKQCATSEAYAYIASNGAALKEAFRSIAINISRLRIAR